MQRVAIIGYGAVGQALTPLLLARPGIEASVVSVVCPDADAAAVASSFGLGFTAAALTAQNFAAVLESSLAPGDCLINVSVDVCSAELIRWCRDHGVLYLDTCIEPWAGGYGSPSNPVVTTNYALRNEALALHVPGAPTAVVAHGANPGLVSHFAKAGMLELAELRGVDRWDSWADLARRLDVRVIQIAERDTQTGLLPAGAAAAFCNTWSADGLLAEAWQCAELGWGSHEDRLPALAHRHDFGDGAGIRLDRHGVDVRVRSWVPSVGPQSAHLITHHEALSIASFLTIPGRDAGTPRYRPTVYYAYRPSPLTAASLERWVRQGYGEPPVKRLLRDDLAEGFDQLGALFVFPGGAYWYGSTLTLQEARALAPCNNATTMQVAAGIIAAFEWMRRHRREGVVEAESMDHEFVLAVARPYLGDVSGVLSDWQPAPGSGLQWRDFAPTGITLMEESLS
ncbi:MAG TPA: saccharopine dehydrogenase NADP-binding domain-containing protein [Rhodocyclaceae bacterium]